MHSPKRLKITDVNPHLICVLCGGYYIDATTVIECLHSFCRSCIVKYLEKNKYCPICDVQIHKSTPLLSIRPDKTLQNIVYKLVPTLFKNEMQRRVEFYEKHPEAIPALPEQRGEVTENSPIFFPDELLIVCLEYHDNQVTHQMRRYLHCPASLPISHLVKLIKGKFNLNAKHQVNIFYKDDLIMENVTLMDIAYTYQCRRKVPIHLSYRILELRTKTIRIINVEPRKEVVPEKQPEKEWKEVQLQISENGVMSVRNVESGESSPIPAVEAPLISPSLMASVNEITNPSTLNVPPVVSQCNSTLLNQTAALINPSASAVLSEPTIPAPIPAVVNTCNDSMISSPSHGISFTESLNNAIEISKSLFTASQPTLSTSLISTTSSVSLTPRPSPSVSTLGSIGQANVTSPHRTASPFQPSLSLKRTYPPSHKSSSPHHQSFSPVHSPLAISSPHHTSVPSPIHLPTSLPSSIYTSQNITSCLPSSTSVIDNRSSSLPSCVSTTQNRSSPILSSVYAVQNRSSPLPSLISIAQDRSSPLLTPACTSQNNSSPLNSPTSTSKNHLSPRPTVPSTTENSTPLPASVSTAQNRSSPLPTVALAAQNHASPLPALGYAIQNHSSHLPALASTTQNHSSPLPSPLSTTLNHSTPPPSPAITSQNHTTPLPSPVLTSQNHTTPLPSPVVTSQNHTTSLPSPVVTSENRSSPLPISTSHFQNRSSPALSANSSTENRSSPIPSVGSVGQSRSSPLPTFTQPTQSPSYHTVSASLHNSMPPLLFAPTMSSLITSLSSHHSPLVSMPTKSISSTSGSIVTPAMSLPLATSTQLPPSNSSQASSITAHPVSMLASSLNIPSPPISLANHPSPSLPISPSIVPPNALISNHLPHSPQDTITTMAGLKSSPNLLPITFPIMSPCRSQTEPIVSVSKVSKDQVRKPSNSIQNNKLSISRVPPGGMKEKSENLNKIVNKLSPNERVIGNTSVTIRPVVNSPSPPKLYQLSKPSSVPAPPTSASKEKSPIRYSSLKSPTKQWNPSIDRNTMLMKQSADQNKSSRFFKMRNMPRFLGNPSSGVKPMYACPEEPVPNCNQNKQKLTLLKVDPKTIPTSSIPRSPTKQPPPYTPGSPKLSKPPPAYSDPKPFMNSRMPSPAHSSSFLPPNPYHLLYSGYGGFSPDASRMISPDLIRTMCAYHPAHMLFNPMHALSPRPQDSFKPDVTPSVQRIPPSKTGTPPPKPIEEKQLPSPVGPLENKKISYPQLAPMEVEKTPQLTPMDVDKPRPLTPMDVDKPPPLTPISTEKPSPPDVEPPPKVNSNSETPPDPPCETSSSESKDTDSSDVKDAKPNDKDSNVVKLDCDDININNNNNNNTSKESPPSQPSESLANKSQ